jgi:hypothetical protein
VELGSGAAFWGPSFDNTAGRTRYALNDGLAIESE